MRAALPKLFFILALVIATLGTYAQSDLTLNYLSTHYTDVFNEGAAEIAAFDPGSARVFFVNANANSVGILDISDPSAPNLINTIFLSNFGGKANSVAVFEGLVAVAVESGDKVSDGKVIFFDVDGNLLKQVDAGALPDMVTFTRDGKKVLTADEGEPDDTYTIDPLGSVTVIDLTNGVENATPTKLTFESFNSKKAYLLNRGIRIFGPNATVAQDLEPEYITVSPDNSRAYVSLQENNALAVIDLATPNVLDILPLGYKDHSKGAPFLQEFLLNELPGWPVLGAPVYGGGQDTVMLGGFSGLYFDPTESDGDNYVFYMIPDRGPNDEPVVKANVVAVVAPEIGAPANLRPYKLPEYQARIVKVTLSKTSGEVTLDEQFFLKRVRPGLNDTVGISGTGNVPGFDELPVTYTDENTPYFAQDWIDTTTNIIYTELLSDAFGGDFEGIVRDKDGNFWLCDENRPSIYKVAPDGMLIDRYVPEGTAKLSEIIEASPGDFGNEILPRVYNKRWANRGFEAIAYDPDEDIVYAFIQSPLFNPDSRTQNKSDVIRILGISAEDGTPVREYVYLLDRNRESGYSFGRVDKIGDAVYTGNGKFLVLERDSGTPLQNNANTSKKLIFEIDIKYATNIIADPLAAKDELADENDKTLEMMSADELAAAGIQPVFKRLLFNLPSIGYLPSDKSEGIALLPDGSIAVMNDNDFGIAGAGVSDVSALGIITLTTNFGFDASDRDNGINILNRPTLGMYQPDAITTFEHEGQTFVISANEGDARDYEGFSEEERIGSLDLDAGEFPDAATLKVNGELGRLRTTSATGDLNGDNQFDRLFSFGARSFSIWDQYGNRIYDSGDEFELITAQEYPQDFNSNDDEANSFDSRSDDKGPEPESVSVGTVNERRYAFIGLERIGGIMVYDISDPTVPQFVEYVNTRNFDAPINSRDARDVSPEDVKFIPAEDSPNGLPMLIAAHEVSGTVTIFSFDRATDLKDVAQEDFPWRLFPNPVADQLLTNIISDYEVYNNVGQRLMRSANTDRINVRQLPAGSYFIKDLRMNRTKLFVKQ